MAFQKTEGRKAFIQPNGMPDFSGFQQAAREYSNLADAAFSIGTGIRSKSYNDAILEAEIAGKTAGARYEKDPKTGEMKLVPLTNLDYAKASEMYSDNEREGILRAYKNAAMSQYVMSAKLDIESTAEKALSDFPNDPEKIRAVADGVFTSLKSLEPQVYSSLAPSAVYSFTTAENQALAQQQKDQKDLSISTHRRMLSSNTRKIANLTAKGVGSDDIAVDGINTMINEIMEENDGIYETLLTNGVTESEILALRELQTNVVASRAGQAHVERAFTAGGMPAALDAISTILEENYEDSGIDSDRLSAVLTATANKLESMRVAERSLSNRMKEQTYHSIIKSIVVDGASVDDMLGNPDSSIYTLDGGQIASLTQQGRNLDRMNAAENYNQSFGFLQNWKNVVADNQESEISDAFFDIRDQWIRKDITSGQWLAARISFKEYIDSKFNQPKREKAGLAIAMEMGANSKYEIFPAEFSAMIPELKQRGIIGDIQGSTWKDESAFLADLNKYSKEHDKFQKTIALAETGFNSLRAGQPISKEQSDAVASIYGTNKAFLDDMTPVDMDFFNPDDAIVQASIDTADVYSSKFNGLMHPKAKDIIGNAQKDINIANVAVRVLVQSARGLAKTKNINEETALNDIYKINDFSEDTRRFFQIASKVGVELAIENAGFESRSTDERDMSSIVLAGKDGMSKEQASEAFFDETLSSSLGAFGFYNFFDFDQQGPEVQAILDNFVVGTGVDVDDLKNIIVQDPQLKRTMKNIFFERYAYERKLGMSPKDVMFSVFRDIGTRYGVEQDPSTGDIYYKKSPILAHAQSTVPLMESGTTKGEPILNVTNDMIRQDIILRLSGRGEDAKNLEAIYDKDLLRDLEDLQLPEGNNYRAELNFIANQMPGEGTTPSYTIVLTDRFGNDKLLSDRYKFNYHNSHLNEDFEKAQENIRSQKVKQYLRLGGVFDPYLVQQQLNKFAKTRDNKMLVPIIELVNGATKLTKGTGFDVSDFRLDKNEAEDFLNYAKYVLTLGVY